MAIRKIHSYLGVFIAPSVLFFASTGALQLFNLHETHPGYQPPVLLEKLARVHKDQRFEVKANPASAPAPKPSQVSEHAPMPRSGRPRFTFWRWKWLFLMVAIGLVTSSLLGLWMGLTHSRHKIVALLLLLAGAALPVLILAL